MFYVSVLGFTVVFLPKSLDLAAWYYKDVICQKGKKTKTLHLFKNFMI